METLIGPGSPVMAKLGLVAYRLALPSTPNDTPATATCSHSCVTNPAGARHRFRKDEHVGLPSRELRLGMRPGVEISLEQRHPRAQGHGGRRLRIASIR